MITIEPILNAFRNGNPLSTALDLFIRENPDHQFAIVLKKLHFPIKLITPLNYAIIYVQIIIIWNLGTMLIQKMDFIV